MSKKKTPDRARKWLITINNPTEKKLTHTEIKSILKGLPSLIYWCMADEIGNETGTYHTHVYICLKNPIRFATLQNKFHDKAHLTATIGTSEENRNYVFKQGKWETTDKKDTQVVGTQEEGGELPSDGTKPLAKNEKFYGTLYSLIENGYTDGEIIAENPNYIPLVSKFAIIRNAIRTKEFAYTRRNVEVHYIWGAYRWDKVREIRDTFGDENVYSVADYDLPFEDYECQDIILLEEFSDSIPFPMLMHYLQEYPVKLSARYSNKVSCYTKVYIVSEFPLQDQFRKYQYEENVPYQNFLNKITEVVYCESKDSFQALQINEQICLPSELPFQ